MTGIVQGVGFRPHVYGLAARLGLAGFVANDSRGVTVEVEGLPEALDNFERELRTHPPPQAAIDGWEAETAAATGAESFEIRDSAAVAGESTPVSPDLATCPECLAELFDAANRRYRYPFLNCTNCGPRFTIVRDVPYDRPLTTMAAFRMCPACEREYHDPANRRFHAQPNACPECGPRLAFHPGGLGGEAALERAMALLEAGAIVAIKGIGGFHLACDARNEAAVAELRRRKGRVDKPFALMARDVAAVQRYARVEAAEARLLASRERPIVLLRRLPGVALVEGVAPGQARLGFFLPYSPLHHLLVGGEPLVMTSGNRSDEPIARGNEEALERLRGLADGFLLHDREIHVVCDDSVVRLFEGREMPVRRSRGYAPLPVALGGEGRQVLAVGGELKATFCLTRGGRAYMSQHIGDMENIETLEAFERAFHQMRALFRVEPEAVACDLHPGYLSTRWAREFAASRSLPLVAVQHHHAHVTSLMAESGEGGPVIGVAFDGTGYGTDGAIWGGEFLLAEYSRFERLAHLKYVPLPGGDAGVKRPYRMALTHLRAAGIEWQEDLPCVAPASAVERAVIARGLHVVNTSSMGRLFDAVASLLGLRQVVNYEAQGAMELEAAAESAGAVANGYGFDCSQAAIDPAPVWRALTADLRRGEPVPAMAARFHLGVAQMVAQVCLQARGRTGVETVALTGGVFQNAVLLGMAVGLLRNAGFRVLVHRVVPANDGGLALGQAAAVRLRTFSR